MDILELSTLMLAAIAGIVGVTWPDARKSDGKLSLPGIITIAILIGSLLFSLLFTIKRQGQEAKRERENNDSLTSQNKKFKQIIVNSDKTLNDLNTVITENISIQKSLEINLEKLVQANKNLDRSLNPFTEMGCVYSIEFKPEESKDIAFDYYNPFKETFEVYTKIKQTVLEIEKNYPDGFFPQSKFPGIYKPVFEKEIRDGRKIKQKCYLITPKYSNFFEFNSGNYSKLIFSKEKNSKSKFEAWAYAKKNPFLQYTEDWAKVLNNGIFLYYYPNQEKFTMYFYTPYDLMEIKQEDENYKSVKDFDSTFVTLSSLEKLPVNTKLTFLRLYFGKNNASKKDIPITDEGHIKDGRLTTTIFTK